VVVGAIDFTPVRSSRFPAAIHMRSGLLVLPLTRTARDGLPPPATRKVATSLADASHPAIGDRVGDTGDRDRMRLTRTLPDALAVSELP